MIESRDPARRTLMLLGRSGSGRPQLSTDHRILTATQGEVRVDGLYREGLIQYAGTSATPFRKRGFFPTIPSRKCCAYSQTEGWQQDKIKPGAEVLHMVGLSARQYAGRYPDQLSGGQSTACGSGTCSGCRSPSWMDERCALDQSLVQSFSKNSGTEKATQQDSCVRNTPT